MYKKHINIFFIVVVIVLISGCSSVFESGNAGETIEVTNQGLENISVSVYTVDDTARITVVYNNGTEDTIRASELGIVHNYYEEVKSVRINSSNHTMLVPSNSNNETDIPEQNQNETVIVVIKNSDGTLIEVNGISCLLSSGSGPAITYTLESGAVSTRGKSCE